MSFCWASGMGVRLEGQALFLLSDELDEVAEENLAAAREVAAILRYALEQVRIALAAYGKLLDRTRGRDDLTHRLLVKLARQLAARETDLEGALA